MDLKVERDLISRLLKYDWEWSGKLNCRNGRRRNPPFRLFREWIAWLQAVEPEPLSWVCVLENSHENHQIQLHVLIAGLQHSNLRRATALWRRMAGMAEIEAHDPNQMGLPSALEFMQNTPEPDFGAKLHDCHLHREPHRESLQQLPAELATTEGLRHRRVKTMYALWLEMVQQCRSPKPPNYKHHGPKRAAVCCRWKGRNGFHLFMQDMGERPSPFHRLRRIDKHAAYSPSNCIWVVPGN